MEPELVFYVFVNGEYKRTFVNDVQINEFSKRIWNKDKMAKVLVVPVHRVYVQLRGSISKIEIEGTLKFD